MLPFHILRAAAGFEKCSQNGVRIGYSPLESNISNWSNVAYLKTKADSYVILHNQALSKFYARERSWRRGHGRKTFLSHSSLLFCLLVCSFRMLGHLRRAWLALTGLHYEGTTVNRTFFGPKIWAFFLSLEAFRALPLHARDLLFILLLHRIPY